MLMPKLPRGIYLLLLLNANKGEPIVGRLRLEKMVFLLSKEVLNKSGRRITEKGYSFRAYKFGPFTEEVYDDIETMANYDFISSNVDRNKFEITERGKNLIIKLNEENHLPLSLILDVENLKRKYNNASIKSLLKYVYKNYNKYINESEIRDKILGSL